MTGATGAVTADSLALMGNITNTVPSPANPLLSTQNPFLIETANNNPILFGTNSTLQWGINTAGDWTIWSGVGTLMRPIDSVGVPTLSGVGFGTGAALTADALDYGFVITTGSGSATATGNVLFGHSLTGRGDSVSHPWSRVHQCGPESDRHFLNRHDDRHDRRQQFSHLGHHLRPLTQKVSFNGSGLPHRTPRPTRPHAGASDLDVAAGRTRDGA